MKTRLLVLDPSSTAVGWALVEGDGPSERTLRWGVIQLKDRPAAARSPGEGRGSDPWGRIAQAAALVAHLVAGEAACADVVTLKKTPPDEVVIEVPGVRPSGRQAGGSFMAVYGAAVGACYAAAVASGLPVRCVPADEWTRLGGVWGMTFERRRGILERIELGRGYDPARDPGGDGCDAIMLGMVALRRPVGVCVRKGSGLGEVVGCADASGRFGSVALYPTGGPPVGRRGGMSVTRARSASNRAQPSGVSTRRREP